MSHSCCTITRYSGRTDQDLEQLGRFLHQAETYSTRILVGVNIDQDITHCIEKYSQQSFRIPIDLIPIRPWIGISTPLNILLNHLPIDDTCVLIQSVEIQCTSKHIDRLRSYLIDDDILCVGVALDGHQILNKTFVQLQGDTSPWNTFALWNLEKLIRTGFPTCADRLDPPGMEDAAVIALQQRLFGGAMKNRVLLIRLNEDVRWLNRFEHDEQRSLQHQKKMKSKNKRTEQLLYILNANDAQEQIGVEYIIDKKS